MALSKLNNDSFDDTAVHGRRNLVINGAATVNQRGDVTGQTSSTYGGPDRFRLGISASGTFSISQSSTAPDGFSNSYKLDCTTADTTPTIIASQYRIEAQDLQRLQYGSSSAKKVTVSFYVRSNLTGTYVLELVESDTTRHICKTYTISSANTWELKTLTFDGDTGGAGITDDNGVGIQLNFWLAASSTYTSGTLATSWASQTDANRAAGLNVNLASSTDNEWLITGLQFEIGDKATPFEHRSFAEELALCQRYHYRIEADEANDGIIGAMANFNGTSSYGVLSFPVEMRTAPSGTKSADSTFTFYSKGETRTPTNVIVATRGTKATSEMHVDWSSSLNDGGAGWLRATNDSCLIAFDAEL